MQVMLSIIFLDQWLLLILISLDCFANIDVSGFQMVHPDTNIIDLYQMFNILFWFLITNSKKARHARHVSHCKMHVFKETFLHGNI